MPKHSTKPETTEDIFEKEKQKNSSKPETPNNNSSLQTKVTKDKSVTIQKQEIIPGLEGVEQDMLMIPRLKLVQKMSVETDMGIDPGAIVNSVTKDVVGKPSKQKDGDVASTIIIMPILNNKTRLLFKQIKEGGGLACRSIDGKIGIGQPGGVCSNCPANQWGDNNEPPDCTELLNVYCVVRDYDSPIPIVVSFGRTSSNAGKQLINFFYMDARRNQVSPWNFAYELKSVKMKNDKGTFYVYQVKPAGKATPEEVEIGAEYYRLIKSVATTIHEDENEIAQEQQRMNETQNEDEASTGTDDIPF